MNPTINYTGLSELCPLDDLICNIYFQASALTSAGEGAASSIRNAMTLKSLPDPVTDITADPSLRNETCMRLYWTSSDPDVFEFNVSDSQMNCTI